jgi:SAM-dependent methyltransferase
VALPVLAAHPSMWSAFVACALAASAGIVVLWTQNELSLGAVLIGAVALRLAFAPLLPVLSDDMFRYVWDGWLQWQGVNPYRFPPDDPALAAFQDLPLYAKLNSASYYSVYPPLSQLIFALGGAVHSTDWTLSYYVIKGVLLTIEGVGIGLLAQMTSARNVLLYAWNPLVLVEIAGQAHTEAAVVPLLIAAVWAVRTNRGGLASGAVAAAGMVKLYPFVLGPFLLRRFGWKAVWPGIVVSVVLSIPYAAPYVLPHVKESVDLYFQLFEFNAAPYYFVKEGFMTWTGEDWSKAIGPAFRGLFLGLLPVLYGIDAWRKWSIERAFLMTLGVFFVLSTTVHPWYLLGILPLAVLQERPSWHWIWLGTWSMGTYLLYVDGPYWIWVWVGWGGALAIALIIHGAALLQWIQKRRADRKVELLKPYIKSVIANEKQNLEVIDLGAGEGYVGDALSRELAADVTLVDVVDMNRTPRPLTVYDGETLPYADNQFDVTVVSFVLHHCEDPEQVLSEALRVSSGGVVILESVITSPLQHRILRLLDRAANRIRSFGKMADQEEHLHFRRVEAWERLIETCAGAVQSRTVKDGWIHPQAVWAVKSTDASTVPRGEREPDSVRWTLQ